MQPNLFKVLAMTAVVLTVQSAPAEIPSDVDSNTAETNGVKTDMVQADVVQADGAQTEELPVVQLVRTLCTHDTSHVSLSRD